MDFNNNFPKPFTIDSLSNSGEPNLSEEVANNLTQKSIPNFYGNSCSEISSKKSDNISTSSKLEEDLPLIKDLIFCNHCKKPYYIIFTDNLDLSFDCDCSLLKNLTIEEYKNEYIKFNKENLYQKSKYNSLDKDKNKYLLHCKIHPKEHQLEYYCTDCKYDLCKECLQEYCRLDSDKNKIFKLHENHTKIKLDDIIPKIENIKNSIEILNQDLDKNNYKIYNKEKKKKIKDIFSIIITIILFYKEYKCYNFYRSIENAEIFLEKIKNNFNFGKHEGCLHSIKITSLEDLDKINNFEDILTINIMHSQIPIDLSIFKVNQFEHLEELILINNKINDITPLFSCKFPVLKKFNLGNNKIGNELIELFKKVKFPEIIYISFYNNNITSLEIFDIICEFKNLQYFYVGENKFDFNANSKSFYKFPEKIKEFGLTGNFDGENVEFVEKLGINNLETFYFSRNKLKNLNNLNKITFNKLSSFWAITNEITDIKEIMNINERNDLKIINLKENKINNFHELFEIINYFPKLELLNVSKNNIKKEELEEMKKRIKEKYNRDLDIKFEEKN